MKSPLFSIVCDEKISFSSPANEKRTKSEQKAKFMSTRANSFVFNHLRENFSHFLRPTADRRTNGEQMANKQRKIVFARKHWARTRAGA
jgi:hypothetical protein